MVCATEGMGSSGEGNFNKRSQLVYIFPQSVMPFISLIVSAFLKNLWFPAVLHTLFQRRFSSQCF